MYQIYLCCVIYPSHAVSVFLTWCTPPLGIYMPCLAGHLTLLSLRLCCHGNSNVTGPGWAWGMSCGVMARFLQQRERRGCNGRGEVSEARPRWLVKKLWGLWRQEEKCVWGGGENLSPLCFKTVFIVLLNELKSIISSICDVEWKEKPHWIWFLFLVKLLVGFLESSEDAFSSYIVR